MKPLCDEGIRLPFVWNSSGYERIETLEEYADLCDCALFDLRYASNGTAIAASAAPGYVESARAAVKWAWNRNPPDRTGRRVEQLPKLIVRLLVLPGHAEEAVENLAWLAAEGSDEVPVAVVSPSTRAYRGLETPPYDRTVTEEEYETVTEAAADFGFENGWIQGYEAADPKLALLGENMTPEHGVVKG